MIKKKGFRPLLIIILLVLLLKFSCSSYPGFRMNETAFHINPDLIGILNHQFRLFTNCIHHEDLIHRRSPIHKIMHELNIVFMFLLLCHCEMLMPLRLIMATGAPLLINTYYQKALKMSQDLPKCHNQE